MYHVLTCNGYKIDGTFESLCEAIEYCRARESKTGDGWARVVSCDGQFVADSDGEWNLAEMNRPDPFDLACERRFD